MEAFLEIFCLSLQERITLFLRWSFLPVPCALSIPTIYLFFDFLHFSCISACTFSSHSYHIWFSVCLIPSNCSLFLRECSHQVRSAYVLRVINLTLKLSNFSFNVLKIFFQFLYWIRDSFSLFLSKHFCELQTLQFTNLIYQ